MFGRKQKKYSLEDIEERYRDVDFEKNDLLGLVIAALITIIPMVLIILGIIIGILWFIFLR